MVTVGIVEIPNQEQQEYQQIDDHSDTDGGFTYGSISAKNEMDNNTCGLSMFDTAEAIGGGFAGGPVSSAKVGG